MKRGPKPQPEAHRAKHVIRARVTAAELTIAKDIAKNEDLTISDLIRVSIGDYRPRKRPRFMPTPL